jgi:GNAT superfamily N-acetyltransferase
MPGHAGFNKMSLMDHAAVILRRLARTNGQSSFEGERPLEHRPISATQREVRFSDFESVATLKERAGWGRDTFENWCRLWQQNPAIAGAKSHLSMGWVLETTRGIVGYQGSVPLLYQLGARTLVAATGTSLVVEPAYRARGIGLLASFYRQTGVDLFLITTAIPSVGEASKLLRARALPQCDYDTALWWVIDARQFAKAVAARLGLRGRMAAVGAVLGSWALRADKRIHGRRPRHVNKFSITEIQVKDIGNEFQALWERKIAERPRLMADRSASSLKWHFAIPPSLSTIVVLCCHRVGRLVGYAIVRHTIDHQTGIRKGMLADFLVEQDDCSVAASLLEAAYANAVALGDHLFEVVGLPQNIRQILMHWNPYLKPLYPAPIPFFYKVRDQGLAQTLSDGNAWYAGPFDGDTTLMP